MGVNIINWLCISPDDLIVERQQLIDEGRDISGVEVEFQKFAGLSPDDFAGRQEELRAFLDRTAGLPMKADYPYQEPSDLAGIKKLRPEGSRKLKVSRNQKELYDKILGAWLGRCAGCLLGKPVEGWRSGRMWGYLKDLNRYPLNDYFRSDVPEEIQKKYQVSQSAPFINRVNHMVEDDDTNYTVSGLAIVKKYGFNFTPEDVALFWLENIPILHTCTAERVAYRNICQLILPPASAVYRNPYREWIGAQIRADFFGYVAAGNPEQAAGLAWRDASISVATMLAAAPFLSDLKQIIGTGLSEIPGNCRLSKGIREIVAWHEAGVDYQEAVTRIHAQWDENSTHHWCHTISNAQVVALGLLWGGGDFEKSICRAVQACFDTDCNGATVGSIVGMMLGAKELPAKWVKPLNDKIETGISGYHQAAISGLAKEGFNLYQENPLSAGNPPENTDNLLSGKG
ncbi:MAG: ADP-ribosylglycohydrolase family protein [Candidatus Omnitrophica bacterium]|nr:ADP-ribosylglycohydrolase family protein [Candidatus Omnitrophota bacterium]